MLKGIRLLFVYSVSLSLYAGGQLHCIDSYQALEHYIQNGNGSSELSPNSNSSDSVLDDFYESFDSDLDSDDEDDQILTTNFLLQIYVDAQGFDDYTHNEIKNRFGKKIKGLRKKNPYVYKKKLDTLLLKLVEAAKKNKFNDDKKIEHQNMSQADIWKKRISLMRSDSSLKPVIACGNKAVSDQFKQSRDNINLCILASWGIITYALIVNGVFPL